MIFALCVCGRGKLKIQSLFYGVIGLIKLLFLKAFKQMFLKERIDRTAIIILVKINHSAKHFYIMVVGLIHLTQKLGTV